MLLFIAAFACLGGFLFGYDLGLIAGALLYMDHDVRLHLTTSSSEIVVGMAKLGAVFGTFVGGALMVEFGRKKAIAGTGMFFLVGPLVMAVSSNAPGLSFGRFVVGLGIGASAVCVPAYVGEMALPETRGALVVTYELMLCLGMVTSALVDWLLRNVSQNWRWMVLAPAFPAMVMLLGVFVLPESPRWLVVQGRLSKALDVLHSLREGGVSDSPDTSTARVERELMELWSAVEKERGEKMMGDDGGMENTGDHDAVDAEEDTDTASASHTTTRVIRAAVPCDDPYAQTPRGGGVPRATGVLATTTSFLKTLRSVLSESAQLFSKSHPEHKPVRVAAVLAFFNQASCSTSLVNYAPLLLRGAGMRSEADAVLFASLISVCKFTGVLLSMFTVDRAGRRPLLIWGSVWCAVSMFLLSAAVANAKATATLAAMCLFMLSFSASWAGVFWVLLSEMFTMRWKGSAMASATAILFATGSLVDFVFLSAARAMGGGAFILVGLICVFAGVYAHLSVPETKGKTLKEVQRGFEVRPGSGSGESGRSFGGFGFESFSRKFSASRNAYVAMTEISHAGENAVDGEDGGGVGTTTTFETR
jgi:MFS family permease|tara:strand:+ start:1807 stop:3576 length:1770 start_codon:yes stop_codon:yes gene_type:complete